MTSPLAPSSQREDSAEVKHTLADYYKAFGPSLLKVVLIRNAEMAAIRNWKTTRQQTLTCAESLIPDMDTGEQSPHDVLGLFMETDSEQCPSSSKRPRSSQDENEENRTLMDAKRSKTDSIIDSSAAKTDKVRGGMGCIENIPPINPELSSTTDMELD
ncbi:MAG: hypothetical protein H7A40_01835 [Chlamydiales bacterium]|nr:hypothetical protein [Chlamydiales bacterium]